MSIEMDERVPCRAVQVTSCEDPDSHHLWFVGGTTRALKTCWVRRRPRMARRELLTGLPDMFKGSPL